MSYSRTIATEYGLVRGIIKDECELYLGIPFAAPPVGDLAFKHPVPPKSWKGVLEVARAPISPVQGKGRLHITADGKDCLYLNVFVPWIFLLTHLLWSGSTADLMPTAVAAE